MQPRPRGCPDLVSVGRWGPPKSCKAQLGHSLDTSTPVHSHNQNGTSASCALALNVLGDTMLETRGLLSCRMRVQRKEHILYSLRRNSNSLQPLRGAPCKGICSTRIFFYGGHREHNFPTITTWLSLNHVIWQPLTFLSSELINYRKHHCQPEGCPGHKN